MALRKIVTVGDPILTKVCRPVTRFDQKLAILIEDMIETMHNANGVGLAGPQVGVMRRLCVVDTGEDWQRYGCLPFLPVPDHGMLLHISGYLPERKKYQSGFSVLLPLQSEKCKQWTVFQPVLLPKQYQRQP